MNSVAETTLPLRSSFTYGRNVTIAMPAEVMAAGTDTRLLVPGQTVIVHTRPPG